jgi:helicase
MEELAKIIEMDRKLVAEISKLRIRVKYGAKEELLGLLRLKGIGRIRARKLFFNGIKDFGDLRKTDLTTLSQILGTVVAEDVKNQLGQEVEEEISLYKRKGQMSLGKY